MNELISQDQYIQIQDDTLNQDLNSFNDLLIDALQKLENFQKLKLLLVIVNYGTRFITLYFVLADYDLFKTNTLLLFSYLLYTFLEFAAMAAALSIIFIAKIVKILFQMTICFPILYQILRLCFIVTFFVQACALLLFSEFSYWGYPILLVSCLLIILILEFLRIVLMCTHRLGITSKCWEIEYWFKILFSQKYVKAYELSKAIIEKLYEFYTNMDPKMKENIDKVWKYKEMKENLEWIVSANKQGTSENLRLSKSQEENSKEEEQKV